MYHSSIFCGEVNGPARPLASTARTLKWKGFLAAFELEEEDDGLNCPSLQAMGSLRALTSPICQERSEKMFGLNLHGNIRKRLILSLKGRQDGLRHL